MFETFHPRGYGLEALLLRDEIQFFDASGQHLGVDLAWHICPVRRSLMFQLFSNGLGIKSTLALTTITADPLEPIVLEKLHHFFGLLLVLVSFNGQSSDLVDAVIACSHCQLLVLIL